MMVVQTLNSPIERGLRLKKLRNMSMLNQTELSKLTNVGVSTIKYWELGKGTGLTEEGASKIYGTLSEKINFSISWLLRGIGPAPFFVGTSVSTDETETIEIEIECFLSNNVDSCVVYLEDDAMIPYIEKGDIVGGIKQTKIVADKNAEGSLYIIKLKGHTYPICRRLIINKQQVTKLTCTNIDADCKFKFIDNPEFEYIARVIWIRKS